MSDGRHTIIVIPYGTHWNTHAHENIDIKCMTYAYTHNFRSPWKKKMKKTSKSTLSN